MEGLDVRSISTAVNNLLVIPGAAAYTWVGFRVLTSTRVSRRVRRLAILVAVVFLAATLAGGEELPRTTVLVVAAGTVVILWTRRGERLFRRAFRVVQGLG